jgi:hypothetical protein
MDNQGLISSNDYFFSCRVQIDCSYIVQTELLSRGKGGCIMKLTTQLNLEQRSKVRGAVPLLFLSAY